MPSFLAKDGAGGNAQLSAHYDAHGNLTLGHTPLVAGLPVASANPMPIADTAAREAFGAPADAAYVSGAGSVVALLKAVFARLAAGLTVGGSAAVGAAATGAPVPVSGVDGDGATRRLLTEADGALRVAASGNATVTQATAPVTTASSVVLVAKANRRFLEIQNTGEVDAILSFTGAAVAGAGRVLYAGDTLRFDGSRIPTNAVAALVVSGSTTLFVAEG